MVLLVFVTNAGLCQHLVPDETHSRIDFYIRNLGFEVKGSLLGLKGSIKLDSTDITASTFLLTADASTIDTGISLRDQHLKKQEYLDTKKYPVLRFTSNSVMATPKPNEIEVKGLLTIKNTSKEILILVKMASSLHNVNFSGSFMINRRDYMVGGASFSLADEIKVCFHVSGK